MAMEGSVFNELMETGRYRGIHVPVYSGQKYYGYYHLIKVGISWWKQHPSTYFRLGKLFTYFNDVRKFTT